MSATSDREVADLVRTRVAKRMRQLSLGENSTSDEGLTSGQEQYVTHRHRMRKSGMDRMGATMVVKNITFLHTVVYSLTGKPVTYKDLSVPAFVQ